MLRTPSSSALGPPLPRYGDCRTTVLAAIGGDGLRTGTIAPTSFLIRCGHSPAAGLVKEHKRPPVCSVAATGCITSLPYHPVLSSAGWGLLPSPLRAAKTPR